MRTSFTSFSLLEEGSYNAMNGDRLSIALIKPPMYLSEYYTRIHGSGHLKDLEVL